MRLISDKSEYVDLWVSSGESILQSYEWGNTRSNYVPLRFEHDGFVFTVLIRKFPLFNRYIGYVPRVKNIDWVGDVRVCSEVIRLCKEEGFDVSHLTFEPEVRIDSEVFKRLNGKGHLNWLKSSVQPRFTNVVSLVEGEEEMLMRMKTRHRQNVRKGLRSGAVVELENTVEGLETFFKCMDSIYKRTGYVMYGIDYFRKLYDEFVGSGGVDILICRMDGEVVGGLLNFHSADMTYELHGGTTNAGRDVEAGYLLKWEAMKNSKSKGKSSYDHWGVADILSDGSYDPSHSMFNISKFKLGFGGENISYIGTFDYVDSNLWYLVFRLAVLGNKKLIKLKKWLRGILSK